MNTRKFLFLCFAALMISACATKKEQGYDVYKNFTSNQLLQRGKQALAKHDYSDATKYFEAIDALYPYSPEVEQGQVNIIYAYYKADDHASALAAASHYIHLYPESKYTDYAYYLKGMVNFGRDSSVIHKIYPRNPEKLDVANLEEALADFKELTKVFPQSIYAVDARKKIIYIRNLLVAHDLHIARFYFERKAYVAAINRAVDIVKQYNETPQVKDALKIIIKSYRALGIEKQANEALKVLNHDFPKERV